MDTRIEEVNEFWFSQPFEKMFAKDSAFDEAIREKFGALHADAASGVLSDWRGTPRGDLALLVLLDQFPRNLFRDSARAFMTDAPALQIARTMDRSALSLKEQMVSLLPYQHVEDRSLQAEGVDLYEQLAAKHPDDKGVAMSLDYAKKHKDIVDRFGRFPHRNATLGRESTPEEIEFLKQPGSSF
jgi:uncharacterized protein (DUF924 family)